MLPLHRNLREDGTKEAGVVPEVPWHLWEQMEQSKVKSVMLNGSNWSEAFTQILCFALPKHDRKHSYFLV